LPIKASETVFHSAPWPALALFVIDPRSSRSSVTQRLLVSFSCGSFIYLYQIEYNQQYFQPWLAPLIPPNPEVRKYLPLRILHFLDFV